MTQKGRKITWGDKISKALKGRKLSEEHKKKLSESHKRNPNRYWLGKHRSKEVIEKLREGRKKFHFSDEQKKQMRESHLGIKSHFWKGGISTYGRKLYLNLQRRAKKMNAEGSHTEEEWQLLKKQHEYKCLCCKRKEPEIKLTEDHIIPLSKNGTDYIKNIQPLCKSCNSIKYKKIIDYRKVIICQK